MRFRINNTFALILIFTTFKDSENLEGFLILNVNKILEKDNNEKKYFYKHYNNL